MGFVLTEGVPALLVFIQGVLSFFSPCVLPVVPLYLGYLSAGAREAGEDGTVQYRRAKVFFHTLCFVLGVSAAFFLLGLGFTALGSFFSAYGLWITRIGGGLILLLGLYQCGVFAKLGGGGEKRLPFSMKGRSMNPLTAFVLGFAFSFAWTPCVGPALASVLIMASAAQTAGWGFALIGVYTLGFALPFLALGLFSGWALGKLQKHRDIVRYTTKIGGALLILMGLLMMTGTMSQVSAYFARLGTSAPGVSDSGAPAPENSEEAGTSEQAEDPSGNKEDETAAPGFTLSDQYGETHTLSDYKGKVVFLNFWTTWCGYCVDEMPDIEALYRERGGEEGDVVVLGVANPRSDDYPNAQDGPQDEVEAFLAEQGVTYPVVMDLSGEVFANYGIRAFPTTFMIDRAGNVFGYVSGMLTREMMDSIVGQTIEGR